LSASSYGGRYQVIERVGAGGMAEVYRARDELLGREVAVKVLSQRFASDRSFVERFRREAQAAANLNHPNIVSLFDYGSDNDTYYIVMELIDGRGLDEIIKQDGALLPERAAEIASDVAQALGRAHAAGIVHRDVKPSNIMITNNGQTKVTDFGIARALAGNGEQTMTQTGMVIGTAAYLSPEQAQGDPVDARSDVYSLGVVLYEMLSGSPPFAGDTPLSIAYKHVRETPTAPSRSGHDVPGDLEAIVMKALSKNPENRYSSAGEMADDLQRFLGGQRVTATPIMADETMVAPAATGTQVMRETYMEDEEPERNRAAWYVLAALLLLALFGLGAWLLADNLLGDPVEVPNLKEKTVDEARDILEDVGLQADVVRENNRAPVNQVFDQDPNAGETVDEGDTVTLFVSDGRRQVTVPDLTGLNRDDAENVLREEGLRLGDVTREPNDEFEENQVIRQSPSAGADVDAGSRVDLVVSGGPEPTTVPFVVGQQEDDAIAEIDAAGLEAEVQRESSDAEAGEVIAQDPEGGSEADPGDVVIIIVSEGPQEEPMPDVEGENADQAEAFLEEEYGLNVTQEDDTSGDCTEPPGFVCDQEPDEGTPISAGDNATLFVQPGGAFAPGMWLALAADAFSGLLAGGTWV
jgi:eukaryotic-like serine/threonine-protein kinase